jgi:ComF family protein
MFLTDLLYPRVCLNCTAHLNRREQGLCVRCQHRFPKTYFHDAPDNLMSRRFWGRCDVQFASAMFFYDKNSGIRELIHDLKYHSRPEIGSVFGEMYGKELRNNLFFQQIDGLVSVPMHPAKERVRGYNQAAVFAKAMASTMQKPHIDDGLMRLEDRESQTKIARFERAEVINNLYVTDNAAALEGKHLLIIDDVMTSGSTLEACANAILKIPNTKVSIATIAYVK